MHSSDSRSAAKSGQPATPALFAHWPHDPNGKLGILGAEPPLPDLARQLPELLHDFGAKVLRPIGQQLDRLTAAEVIAPGSPYWHALSAYNHLGIDMELIGSLPPADAPTILAVLFEELGWADAGLGASLAASMLPLWMAIKLGNTFIVDKYKGKIGCWGITEPDHGSDVLDPNKQLFARGGVSARPNCRARLTDGKVVVNGQKSAWVSNGTVAEVCLLYCATETADGFDEANGIVVIVPLDQPGVSRGKPLDKLGQRALPQGEIFFDDVAVDIDHMLAGPEDYQKAVHCVHCDANALMGAMFTGTARAAYEIAYDYAHQRRQGGVPIIRHQDVARRIFHMARNVEIARAIARRAIAFNASVHIPSLPAAMFAKITATQAAFEVASAAVQMLGGCGLTHEYPIEKIFRDARSSLIEDGCNEVLAVKGGMLLADEERLSGKR